MTAYQSAINDINEELKSSSKCFISFRTELNHMMEHIVNE